MHAKAATSGADEVVFDLEDAVAPEAKEAARIQVLETLGRPEWQERAVAVRINPADSLDHEDDLVALQDLPPLPGLSVVVPKTESPSDLVVVAGALPGIGLQALIETPAGLLAAAEIAGSFQVIALILGYADLAAALGRRGAELDRSRWVVQQEAVLAAARAAGVQAIDGPWFRLGDIAGLRAAARATRELGFDGGWAIHPEQVEPLNQTYSPSPAELEWAEAVEAAVADAGQTGAAVARLDGAMVDEAMARQARRLLGLPRADDAPAELEPDQTTGPPYFDDLSMGDVFGAPGLTLNAGHAALHQAVIGDRLRLALDAELCKAVTGWDRPMAHPLLVCDVAIGQSTEPSGRVLGNLFYRGLGCRPVPLGTTLRTSTEVVARRATSKGRGIVALRVTTVDGQGNPVLDFWRCPLLPTRGGAEADPAAADDLDAVGAPVDLESLVPASWQLEPLRQSPLGPLSGEIAAGATWRIEAGETVSSAPELARLSLNLAMAHTDGTASSHGRKLVYGGHVIGIAAAHVTRVLPDLVTILAWHSCDHLGPTFGGDVLHTAVEVEAVDALADGALVTIRAKVDAMAGAGEPVRDVLDWRLVGWLP
jgi:citrate lyase beta subunit/acyl dehydratase